MVISSTVLDEANTNGSKSASSKRDSLAAHLSNPTKLPGNQIVIANSSSSSIDSTGAKLATSNGRTSSLPQNNASLATVSSTTTDSELESEQDERYTDDNQSLETAPSSAAAERGSKQRKLARCENGQAKADGSASEQVSRRFKHFHKLFKSEIASEDMPELIDSYVCAYQGTVHTHPALSRTRRFFQATFSCKAKCTSPTGTCAFTRASSPT